MSEEGWKALHPASVVVNLVPRTWAFLRRSWVLVVAILFGRGGGPAGEAMFDLVDMGLLTFLFMGTIGNTVVHFLTLRYRVSGDALEIKTGLLHRQVRVIKADRIQNMELVRNVFHRASGLVEVRIETASGAEVEGELSALDEASAKELMEALDGARSGGRPAEITEEADWPLLVETRPVDLVAYGITGARFGAIAVAAGVIFELVTARDPAAVERMAGSFGTAGAVALFAAAVSGAWVVSIGGTLLRHWGFRLRQKHDDVLVAEEGMFTRRRVELSRRKVQVVSVIEPAVRRMLLGVASVQVETAAVREGQDGTMRAVARVPVVHHEQVDGLLARILPGTELRDGLSSLALRPPARQAQVRAWLVAFWEAVLVSGGVLWWLGWWGLPALLLFPVLLGLATLDHRHQGWIITDQLIVARAGWWSRRTDVVERSKLQSIDRSQGVLLRRWGLGEVVLRYAGGAVALPLVTWEEAAAIQDELLFGLVPRPRAADHELLAVSQLEPGIG